MDQFTELCLKLWDETGTPYMDERCEWVRHNGWNNSYVWFQAQCGERSVQCGATWKFCPWCAKLIEYKGDAVPQTEERK